jgi:HAD superfamily hydrolase (TIGR01490 family)
MPTQTPDEPKVAAFFDLDKTILAASSTFALGRGLRRRGMLPPHTAARSVYAHASYMVRGADHIQMERMKELLSELVTGWEIEVVGAVVAEALEEVLVPLVFPEATELIRWHQQFGRDVVIISSAADEVVRPIGARLGADQVVGTRMEVVDGRYTGVIDFYAYGAHKAEVVRRLAEEHGYDLDASYAYSDSATDLPMLSAVGRPHAVNPDRQLIAHAEMHGWPILHFAPPPHAPRGLSTIPAPTPATVGAVSAVGLVGASAGLGWYLARRRRR